MEQSLISEPVYGLQQNPRQFKHSITRKKIIFEESIPPQTHS